MAANPSLVPEAEQDIAEAYAWYEGHRHGLGAEFIDCVDACLHEVCRVPERHAKVHKEYRRALVRRFPYGIFYEYANEAVIVYSVFHTSR